MNRGNKDAGKDRNYRGQGIEIKGGRRGDFS